MRRIQGNKIWRRNRIAGSSGVNEHLWSVTVFGSVAVCCRDAVWLLLHVPWWPCPIYWTDHAFPVCTAYSVIPAFSNWRMWLEFTSFRPMSPSLGRTFVGDICQCLGEIPGLSPKTEPIRKFPRAPAVTKTQYLPKQIVTSNKTLSCHLGNPGTADVVNTPS